MNNLKSKLDFIDLEYRGYSEIENIPYENLYNSIELYAINKELMSTSISLVLLRGLLATSNKKAYLFKEGYKNRLSQYWHAMEVAHMLMDLRLSLNQNDEDVLLSVCLLHVLEKLDIKQDAMDYIRNKCYLDPKIFYILNLCKHGRYQTEMERKIYYANIQRDYLALLFKLADRGCFITRLYELPASKARDYVSDTKNYFLPMCVYGKEHYEEFSGTISILMEKNRNLVDIVDIISRNYERIHQNLNDEILRYLEENSRIRMEIKKLKGPNN